MGDGFANRLTTREGLSNATRIFVGVPLVGTLQDLVRLSDRNLEVVWCSQNFPGRWDFPAKATTRDCPYRPWVLGMTEFMDFYG